MSSQSAMQVAVQLNANEIIEMQCNKYHGSKVAVVHFDLDSSVDETLYSDNKPYKLPLKTHSL